MDDAVAEHELMAERVLAERNVVGTHSGKESVDCASPAPRSTQRVPFGLVTRAADVKATMIGDVAIGSAQQIDELRRQVFENGGVVDGRSEIHRDLTRPKPADEC